MEENKEKKAITLSLGTGVSLIIILILSIIILAGVYYYEINKIKKENIEPEANTSINTNTNVSTENIVAETNTANEENTIKDNTIVENNKTFNIGTYSKHIIAEGYGEYDKEFRFKDDNTFEASFGEAGFMYGAYKINNDIITCEAISVYSEQLYPSNYVEAKGKTSFKILDESTIKVIETENIKYGGENAPKEGKTFYEKDEVYKISK